MKPARPLRFLRLSAVCAFLFLLAAPAWALPDREIAGREAVDAWLALVDHGKYAESWAAAAPLFRESIPEKKWVELIAQVRTPLGKAERRTLKALFYTDALPDAPPGNTSSCSSRRSSPGAKTSPSKRSPRCLTRKPAPGRSAATISSSVPSSSALRWCVSSSPT